MREQIVVVYVPVIHEGYRRFLAAHGRDRRAFVIGLELYADYRPLAKDIRCLDPRLVARALDAWGICTSVEVLDRERAKSLAAESPQVTLPAEDVSYQIVERYFRRLPVFYDSVFLRWDKSRSAQLQRPQPDAHATIEDLDVDLRGLAEREAARSVDWWRHVGAAIRFANGEVDVARNEHLPHPLSAYTVGDPRTNFHQGVHLELSTVVHAEAGLIADAALRGTPTFGAVMYVTDFPCPPCAKLIALAGVKRLYYREGYAVLDGHDVLKDAGVEVVEVA